MRWKVGQLDELPPGRGKILFVAGQELTIVNQEGRFIATVAPAPRAGPPLETSCDMPGHQFGVGPDANSERLRGDAHPYVVVVTEDEIFLDDAPNLA